MMKDENDDANFEHLMSDAIDSGDSFPSVFISCTTLKDPASFNGRFHNFEIVTYVNYDHLKDYNDLEDYHNEDYKKFKEKIINKLMNNLEKIIPNAKQHIIQAELGTPKTNEFYINSTKGNVYGTEKTLNQVGPFSFKNKTQIENLFLCGACTLSHGVAGATYSGVAAAAAILGCTSDDLLIEDENQKIRIYDAEDSSTWPEWVHTKRADKRRKFV
jgi:all-trans-retinol 13,14-reductase